MFRSGISSLNFVIFFLELYNVFFFNQHFRFLLAMQVVVYVKIFPEQFVILAIKHFFKFLMEEGMNIYISDHIHIKITEMSSSLFCLFRHCVFFFHIVHLSHGYFFAWLQESYLVKMCGFILGDFFVPHTLLCKSTFS